MSTIGGQFGGINPFLSNKNCSQHGMVETDPQTIRKSRSEINALCNPSKKRESRLHRFSQPDASQLLHRWSQLVCSTGFSRLSIFHLKAALQTAYTSPCKILASEGRDTQCESEGHDTRCASEGRGNPTRERGIGPSLTFRVANYEIAEFFARSP